MKGISLQIFAFLWTISCLAAPSWGQGLVWNLPESGTWVRYEGEYQQTTTRADNAAGDLSLQWQHVLEIRCLERETAEWKGADVSCVWLELESTTGTLVDGELEAGPGSKRTYKILVPEQEIIGKEFLKLDVPRAYLPIVKGYRQIGEEDVEELQGHVFQTYPVVSPVLINEHAKIGEQEQVEVTAGSYAAEPVENSAVIENTSSRVTNNTKIWVADQAPFGAVKWTVNTQRETKTLVDPRDNFQKHSEVTLEMQAAEIGTGAVSKLETP